jgi:hypothetical protein
MPIDPIRLIDDLARAILAEILDSWTLEEIEQLIEEMEIGLRKLN